MNAVLPGFIETPMTDVIPEKIIEKVKFLIPQGRLGKPEGTITSDKREMLILQIFYCPENVIYLVCLLHSLHLFKCTTDYFLLLS